MNETSLYKGLYDWSTVQNVCWRLKGSNIASNQSWYCFFFLDLFDTNTNLLLLYLYVQPLKMWYLKQLISYISFDVMTRWAIENKEFFMLFKVEYQKSPD